MTTVWNPYATLTQKQRRNYGILSILGIVALWGLVSGLCLMSPNKLPAPWDVFQALAYLAWDGERHQSLLLTATLWSVGRVLAAGCLVVVIGIPVGVLMGASPKINGALSPLIDPFRSAPVVAFLPIFVMWFGIGEWMKILFLYVGAVVYLIPMVRDAIVAVPREYWIGARDLGATPVECIRHAVLPMAMPRVADAVIVAVSIMWTYITVAEYVNAREGLGQLIQNARRFSAMDQVFAGIIVIIALALLTFWVMQFAKARLYPWETHI
ncbi:MAG: ABC transporter permease [Pseudomonadota bacterium]